MRRIVLDFRPRYAGSKEILLQSCDTIPICLRFRIGGGHGLFHHGLPIRLSSNSHGTIFVRTSRFVFALSTSVRLETCLSSFSLVRARCLCSFSTASFSRIAAKNLLSALAFCTPKDVMNTKHDVRKQNQQDLRRDLPS